ncbi:hesp-417-like protein [Melampsora americana]|nr:hesp-417-like protein [Melampsora americana]
MVLLAALFFMTLGQADAHACGVTGSIRIKKKDCFRAMNDFPAINGQITTKSNQLSAFYGTCQLDLSTADPKQPIQTTTAAIEDGINSDIDQCKGYTTINLDNDMYPDVSVQMYVGAHKK